MASVFSGICRYNGYFRLNDNTPLRSNTNQESKPTKKSITLPTHRECPVTVSTQPEAAPEARLVLTGEIPPFHSSKCCALEGTIKQAEIDHKQEERGLLCTRTGRRSRISAKVYTGGLIASYCVFNRMRMPGEETGRPDRGKATPQPHTHVRIWRNRMLLNVAGPGVTI